MRRSLAIALILTSAFAAVPATGSAQTWRTMDVSRQLHDSSALDVHLKYGAGRLDLRAASSNVLYDVYLKYDAERAEPLYSFSPESRVLDAGISHASIRMDDKRGVNEMRVGLARGVPVDLALEIGAADSRLDLTGLSVRSLRIDGGAGEMKVRWDTLNAMPMHLIQFHIGAASLEATNLANANTDRIEAEAGVGDLTLDFGGTWTHDLTLDTKVTLGSIHLRVPSDVGVQLEARKFAASVDLEGMHKTADNEWESDNWSTAKYHLRVNAQTTFGSLELSR